MEDVKILQGNKSMQRATLALNLFEREQNKISCLPLRSSSCVHACSERKQNDIVQLLLQFFMNFAICEFPKSDIHVVCKRIRRRSSSDFEFNLRHVRD